MPAVAETDWRTGAGPRPCMRLTRFSPQATHSGLQRIGPGGLRLAIACRAESRLRATILGPGSRLFLSLAARRFFWFAVGGRFALETEEKAGGAGSMEFCAVGL